MHQKSPHRHRQSLVDAPEPDSFWLRTVGTLALYSDRVDQPPLMEASKPLALLTYVALAPKGVIPRDHMAELLWPGCELAESRHSLRQCLYRLRQSTGGVSLVGLRGVDLVLWPRVGVDCLEGERLAADGDLSRACELLDGNFLEGFAVPESREFESWAEAQRTRFRDGWARAARRLAENYVRQGDATRALGLSERLATRRPFDDGATRLVMAALAEAGKHATALARFHAHAELLKREIDDEPGTELAGYARELEAYLKSRPESFGALLPLVGRAGQWAALEAAWEAARHSKGSMWLIEGAAGLGKSRLVTELAARVGAAGGVILLGKCFEIERAVPYAAIAEALAPLVDRAELDGLGQAWLGEAARLLPELRERFADLPAGGAAAGSEAAKRRLHEAVARCVEAVATRAPVLVAVDDVHWGDAASLEVLHLLSKRLRGTRGLVVASYRPAELSPVARQFARSLCADRLADVTLLDPLTQDDISDLLSRLAAFEDGAAAETVTRQLHRHTAGNPLFLNELLDSLARQEILVVRSGRWRLAVGAGETGLPCTLGKLLSDRVDALAPWMRACVETLAVCGEESLVEPVAAALQLSEPRAELALRVLEEERLVRRAGAGIFDLAHDELRRLVYQGIPDERRRLLHAAVGRALEAQGEAKRPGGAARLAHHFDQAADQERAHHYALVAAREAGALAVGDVERVHLAVAEAHAPRALPPRAAGLARRRPQRLVTAVSTAALLVAGVTLGLRLAPSLGARPGWQQGTLYLARVNVLTPSHRVRWGLLGRASRAESLPSVAEQPVYFTRPVTDAGETHSKLFRALGDTVQLTTGRSDDGFLGWSPDGRWLAIRRGWRASEARYQSNYFLVDSAGRHERPLTDTRYQDLTFAWSPLGTQIAFQRDSGGRYTLWLADADGGHLEDLSARFRLPALEEALLAFAPDGQRLVALHRDGQSGSVVLHVLDLANYASHAVGIGRAMIGAPPLWSPDGRWIAYSTEQAGRWSMEVVSADGSQAPVTVAELPEELRPTRWTSGPVGYVTAVEVRPDSVILREGRGTQLSAVARLADGHAGNLRLRWYAGDSAVARVDEIGFVRGVAPGKTSLVASAGGFRADTMMVTVQAAPVETLFVERWDGGLDTTQWVSFGSPKPLIVADLTHTGRRVFLNNGDYNHGSGVISTRTFALGEDGLTAEAEAWLGFTGGHWQHWSLGLTPDPPAVPPLEYNAGLGLGLEGPSPVISRARWGCGTAAGDWPAALGRPEGRWRRLAVLIRPDGQLECYVDGQLLARVPLPAETQGRPVALVLRGLSVGAGIYHGAVLVSRGLRY